MSDLAIVELHEPESRRCTGRVQLANEHGVITVTCQQSAGHPGECCRTTLLNAERGELHCEVRWHLMEW